MTATESASLATDAPAIPGEETQPLAVEHSTGLYMTQDHRYFHNGKGPMPSVTTVLNVLAKPALSNWYKRQVAEAAVYRQSEWIADSKEAAVAWLMRQPDSTRDNAASIGTAIHGMVDAAGRSPDGLGGFPTAEGHQEAFAAFQAFLGVCGGSQAIVSSEKAILNLSEGYAGTFDLLMVIRDELWLLDVKTGKGIYPDYALQLAGYGMAEHIALPGDPTLYDFPEPKRYGVLHLRPDKYADGYRLIEYAITDRERLAFLAALELWRWMQERSPYTVLR